MKLTERLLVFIGLSFTMACGSDNGYVHLNGEAQGTTFSIIFRNSADVNLEDQVDSVFQRMDYLFSTYLPTSLISKLNKSTKPVQSSIDYLNLWETCWEVNINTDGRFDPTLGPVINLYNYTNNQSVLPDSIEIVEALKHTGLQLIDVQNDSIHKRDNRAELNLNAVAQGYTVDVLAELLEHYGITDYMIEVGGEVKAKGHNDKDLAWKIGIDKPLISGQRALICKVNLSNKAMATSGNYRKFIEVDGKQVGHILDPRTGYPAPTNLLSASVVSGSCARADAYATAFMCMRDTEVIDLVMRDPDLDVILVTLEAGDTSVYISPGLAGVVER